MFTTVIYSELCSSVVDVETNVNMVFHHLVMCVCQVNITRDMCGVSKLCLETPEDCDPAGETDCLFAALLTRTPPAPNGTDLSLQLRGNSLGYIGLGITNDNATEVNHTALVSHYCPLNESIGIMLHTNNKIPA